MLPASGGNQVGLARPGLASRAAAIFQVLRPPHWLKNGFVFAPLIFSRSFHNPELLLAAVWAAVAFCLASSAVYVWNDLWDASEDRRHADKRYRPIADGRLSPAGAAVLILILLALLPVPLLRAPAAAPALLCFLALNAAYTLALKRLPWVDITVLAAGFLLRVQAGAAAIHVTLSVWMLTATIALAFFLAALKRYSELESHGDAARPALASYRPLHLRWAALAAGAAALGCYGLFIALVRKALLPTMVPVVFGVGRYYWLVTRRSGGGSTLLLIARDPWLLLATLVWAAGSVLALW
jgi:4-hydroxybenzoate polyprenyltransferase